MRIRQALFFAAALGAVAVLAAVGLIPRIRAEGEGSVAALVTDVRDVVSLARESDLPVPEALDELLDRGLTAVAVGELTGQELVAGMLAMEYGSVEDLLPEGIPQGLFPDSAAMMIRRESCCSDEIRSFVSLKFPGARTISLEKGDLYVLPLSLAETLEAGMLPDYPMLNMLKGKDIPLVFRPGSTPGIPGENVALAVASVLDAYPGIRAVVPAGLFVAGYPELGPLSEVLKERHIPVSKVEFSQQIGIGFLERGLYPDILSLHSVRREEILSRRLSREDLIDRFVRASRERSVKILYVRPSDLHSGSRLERFGEECKRISGRLDTLGIRTGWPRTLDPWSASFFAALALALVLVVLTLRLLSRFLSFEEGSTGSKGILATLALSAVLAVLVLRVPSVARLLGAMAASLAAAEASLVALDNFRRPVRGVLYGVSVAVISGLAIASFFGTPWYMLRMGTFSGVKIALLAPPVILLLHDLRRRVHPESLVQVLTRPPVWGELALICFLAAAAGVMVFRSGNVSFVPGWEIRFREFLEQLLVARPRTKEIFAGYPALVIWFVVRRKDLWRSYREIFRLGTTLAFSSVVNSFCHFHTHLSFIFLRVFNGLWTGIILGCIMAAILVFLLIPSWRRGQGVVAG
ncbi:MAG: DUF5693 family protein [Synergistota bacterium]|nr:DUF5693 family protein [Synergistota bacterium]